MKERDLTEVWEKITNSILVIIKRETEIKFSVFFLPLYTSVPKKN